MLDKVLRDAIGMLYTGQNASWYNGNVVDCWTNAF
jgi:hypothetical protein